MKNQICTMCQTINTDTALRCSNCGESLDITISRGMNIQSRLSEVLMSKAVAENEVPTAPHIVTREFKRNGDTPKKGEGTPCLKLTNFESGFQYIVVTTQDDLQEFTLGRPDRESNFVPTIDLTFVDGHEKGVSRFHALIVRYDNGFGITDNSSQNGTFLNGERLVQGETQMLEDGDWIKLGRVKLQVNYT